VSLGDVPLGAGVRVSSTLNSKQSIGRRDRLQFLGAACMLQQKILEDEFPLAGPQRTAASTARYLAIIGFWASLNLDDVVERAAMRTFKKRLPGGRNVRRFARDSHGTMTFCGPDWAKMPPSEQRGFTPFAFA
jgi:hypothetical protein